MSLFSEWWKGDRIITVFEPNNNKHLQSSFLSNFIVKNTKYVTRCRKGRVSVFH